MMSKNQPIKSNSVKREQTAEDLYNELNIRYRVCYKFVPKSSEEEDVCVCNRPVSDQHRKDHENKDAKWDMIHNTYEELNPAHGRLFNGALFTQLALDTPETKVEKILYDVWQISQPRLIMSIIGGAKYFTLSDRLETNFINGIINVALKSDAWIITNGYNVGIVQLVGQAINKSKLTNPKKHITAIGLCKWGSVKDVEKLTDPQYNKKQKMGSRSTVMDNDGKMKKRESGQRDLEMNHSHYLMLDDGRLRFYDIGDYRTRLCVEIAKLQHENAFPIPVVTIVVEGGKDTITNMYHDLRANIPVVIIDGSGRVADFFKRWLLYTKQFDDISKDSDIAYEIGEIDKVTPVRTLPPVAVNHDDTQNFKSNNLTYIQLQLDKSRNTLRGLFKSYAEQLQKDLDAIISHDDDSKKPKKPKPLSNNTKDNRSQKIDTALGQVMYCLQPAVRSGITVFNLNSNNNLSETIFRSICKSRQKYFEKRENDQNDTIEMNHRKMKTPSASHIKERQTSARQNINKKDQSAQRSQLLQLAMDWDCIDVAKEFILQNSLDNILNKEKAFLYALKEDLPTFIYEFIKLGIDPSDIFFPNEEFLTGRTRYRKFFEYLYTYNAVNNDETDLSVFIEDQIDGTGKNIHTIDDLNDVLSTLIGDYMHKLYFNTHEDENKYRLSWGFKEKNIEKNEKNVHVMDSHDYIMHRENKQIIQDYVMRDLFLWSILMNRIDMAKVLLSHMKYRICAALIATKILKEYHNVATHGELKDGYMKSADYFQQYAIECINQCEKNDAEQAYQIVLQRIELYGNVTCLQVAADAKDKLFIATSCCVQAMNNVWYDKIHPQQSKTRNEISMAISFFTLGFLAPFIVTYRQGPGGQKDEPLTESLQPYGIHYSDPYPLEHPRYTKILPINLYLHRLKNYHQALRMKYLYHCIIYCFFLLLFSYVLLFAFQPPTNEIPSIDWTEIVTIILVSFMLIEEINYFSGLDSLTLLGKISSYFRNLFKFMTLTGFVLFYVGLILRFTYADTEDKFTAARIVMAFDLEIWWLRSLTFIIVIPFLGPHLVAIGKMLRDLSFFMVIIAVAMAGYGVASRSMVYYPNADKFNITTAFDGRSVFRQILYPVYYLMYGNFGNELSNLDAYPDAGWSIATQVLLAIHMLFVNILLINLLIAMFSKRFDQVHEDTKNIWHSQQYIFTREYYARSPFIPPISFFYDIYHLCRLTYFTVRRVCFKKPADGRARVFKMIPINKEVIKDWYEFEGASTYEYAHAEVKTSKVASTTLVTGSDSSNNDKREETNDNINDANNSVGNIQQVQDDLAKFNQSLEEIKGQLQTLIASKAGSGQI